DVGAAARDGDVGGRQRVSAEDEGAIAETVSDTAGADRRGGSSANEAAAADAEREDVGKPEVRAHPADEGLTAALLGEAAADDADVGRRAADVDDDRVG